MPDRRSTRPLLAAAVTAGAIQIVPGATWLPSVRRLFPSLAGTGAPGHVALTFDDGPDPRSTPAFLDVLAEHGATATFFLVGERVARAPGVVARMVAEGHEVGVHGWRHRYTFGSSPHLRRCIDATVAAADVRPRWFRPPYGVLSASCLLEARRTGLTPVLWTAWAKDWTAESTPESVRTMLQPALRDGATLLLHDAGSKQDPLSWTSALGALPRLLRDCAERGLRVGTLGAHGVPTRRTTWSG
jgi:peptidoglycan/xylan/chitin deacetylase (PgdA/CDA1 family)